jgi:hypothetical protein
MQGTCQGNKTRFSWEREKQVAQLLLNPFRCRADFARFNPIREKRMTREAGIGCSAVNAKAN